MLGMVKVSSVMLIKCVEELSGVCCWENQSGDERVGTLSPTT